MAELPTTIAGAPPAEAEARRSFRLGVINGAVYMMGEGFVDAGAVIPVFLSRLTHVGALIGLGASLSDIGWFLPQAAVVPPSAHLKRQMPVYRALAVLRSGALAAMAACTLLLAGRPGALLAAFFVFYGAFCFGAGISGISFMEVVGKTVPARDGGRFFAQRLFWGGLLVVVSSLVVRALLRGAPGMGRFAALFALAAVVTATAHGVFIAIREPEAQAPPPARPYATLAREALARVRREPVYRDLLLARGGLTMWASCFPFVVLLAVRDLGGGARATAAFLLARVAGSVLSNLAWQPVARRHGTPAVMRVATLLAGACALGAALVAVAAGRGALGAAPALLALEALAAVGGAAQSGTVLAYSSLMLELAPEGDRPMFVGVLNTLLALSLVVPPVAGALVDRIGAPAVFALCALGAVPCHLAARRLPGRAATA